MFKPIQKVARKQDAHATKIEGKKEGEKKHFSTVFFSIVHGFFTQVTQSKMLREQGPVDVEKGSLKNGHLCHSISV